MGEIRVTHEHTFRGSYIRRFDHAEARLRYDAGERVVDLAAEYGVTPNAIYQSFRDAHTRARDNAYKRELQTGRCEKCGGRAGLLVGGKKKHNPDGRILCFSCRGEERTERLRWDDDILVAVRCSMLDCANGDRWQHPDEFPRGSRLGWARAGGIHNQCRTCQTRARQEYRERKKVPCETCGQPCLPAGEKGQRGRNDRNLCRSCYLSSSEIRESFMKAVEAATARRRVR